MRTTASTLASSAVIIVSVLGCASTPTPNANSAAAQEAAPKSKPAPAAKSEKKTETAAAPAAESEPDPRGDGLRAPSRPPGELITGPNLVYVFNFKESQVGLTAKERCLEQHGDDLGGVAGCMEKARGKIPVEFVRFVKEPSGNHWWITYNRYKGNLLKWHKVQFNPGKETADHIVLNLFGEDKGIAPMGRVPRNLEIELPNDYSIVLKHPEHGAMTYDAKIGTMDTE